MSFPNPVGGAVGPDSVASDNGVLKLSPWAKNARPIREVANSLQKKGHFYFNRRRGISNYAKAYRYSI